MNKLKYLAALPLLCTTFAHAAEQFSVNPPKNYHAGFTNNTDQNTMIEYIPKGETVRNWTEMLTVQTMNNMNHVPVEQFAENMSKMWLQACPNSSVSALDKGETNGYPFITWLQICPNNPSTGKPEITFIKAVKGNEKLYVVQKAFKFKPSKQQITDTGQMLQKISVCDKEDKQHACKK